MNGGPPLLDDIRAALSPHGLFLRGMLAFDGGDGPMLGTGRPAAAIALVGSEGGSFWPAFCAWRDSDPEPILPDPLDRWSKTVLGDIACRFQLQAFYPSDPPFQPFQRWAMAVEGLRPSPLGILIHPEYGLWHGYRGALAFAARPDSLPSAEILPHPCDTCATRPCLSSCPAGAILPEGFQYGPCRGFLAGEGGSVCLENGCLARNACPVGARYRYGEAQLRFHMTALKR